MAIGSKYVYEIDAEEKAVKLLDNEENKSKWLKSFIQDGVNEMKKEISKKIDE